MEEKNNTNDALGNPIEVGKLYGYSTDKNGFTRVTVGNVIRLTYDRVTLKPIHSVEGLWSKTPDEVNLTKFVSVKAMKLFPVDEKNLKRN